MSLPSGYKRLEYIKSSGAQYIDTGIIGSYDTRVTADFEILSIGSGTVFVFGSQANNDVRFCLGITSASVFRSDYGTEYISGPSAATGTKYKADKNRNVCTINGTAINSNVQTFTGTTNIYLFARSYSSLSYASLKMYGCKIYSNDVLVRDFIPCKNASGVVGMWDDVNSVFYQNAGSGTFTAGPEVIGSNRVLVDAKGYDADSGTVLVNGMVYHLKNGRGLLNGMGYDIPFDSRTHISDLAVGSTVKIAVNGTLRDFLIVHQGLPSSLYDDSCNGTWLLMKDIYETRVWRSGDINNYENSDIHAYLTLWLVPPEPPFLRYGIFTCLMASLMLLSNRFRNVLFRNGLSAKIFLLSGYEVGWTTSDYNYFPVDGAKLSYFESGTGTSANNKRIANWNGSAALWWLRSPRTSDTYYVWLVDLRGDASYALASNSYGIRPALVLPSDTLVSDDGTITT